MHPKPPRIARIEVFQTLRKASAPMPVFFKATRPPTPKSRQRPKAVPYLAPLLADMFVVRRVKELRELGLIE